VPVRTPFPGQAPVEPEVDHIREGTREQFESEWTLIPGGHSQEFQHGLGELPWVVSVMRSDVADGTFPKSAVGRELYGRLTFNPGSLADGVGETSSSITVTGAELGDFVQVSAPYDMQDILATGYVSADNTVEIRLQNESINTVNLASGVWTVKVTSVADATVLWTDEDGVVGSGTETVTVTSNLASGTDKFFQVRAM